MENTIEYASIVGDDDDDDTFHQYQFPLPKSLNNIEYASIVGSSYGVFCFYACDMAVVWNPWIRKSVDVPLPNVLDYSYETILGFGVSPQTKDPWRVEVFTLSSGTWKTPSRNSIRFCWGQVALDGVIYWLAFEWIKVDDRFRQYNLIMSFDFSSEVFQEVCLPDNLACRSIYDLSIFKRMESVVVLERDETGTSYGVWMMGQWVTKSFTKLFTVMRRGSSPLCRLHGFTKNGEPIVDHRSDALFAYDPYSERIKDLGIVGKSLRFSVNPYMETLLLIDQEIVVLFGH